MGLEVLFGHLLPELQWDSSSHLLPSADERAQQGLARRVCSPVPRCCPAPPRGSRAALCPVAPIPLGVQPEKRAVAPKPAPEGTNQGLACGQAPWGLEVMTPLEGSGWGDTHCEPCGQQCCERGCHPVTELCGVSPLGRAEPSSP